MSVDARKLDATDAVDRPNSKQPPRPLSKKDDGVPSAGKRVDMHGTNLERNTQECNDARLGWSGHRKDNTAFIPSSTVGIGPGLKESAHVAFVAASPTTSPQMLNELRTVQNITQVDTMHAPLRTCATSPAFAYATSPAFATYASGVQTGGTLAPGNPVSGAQTGDTWCAPPPIVGVQEIASAIARQSLSIAPARKPLVVAPPCIHPCSLKSPPRSAHVKEIMRGNYAEVRVIRSASPYAEVPTTAPPNLLYTAPHCATEPQSSYAYRAPHATHGDAFQVTSYYGGDMLDATYKSPHTHPHLATSAHWDVLPPSYTPYGALRSNPPYVLPPSYRYYGASPSSPPYVDGRVD
eukprot:GEMP01044663.1.p1 GENE.GEMP01044663.1~~GEMP01044663.1.p1  ORF type:complete len:351 (+),score=62.71 GEMP01044663.1:466-1518(+)